MTRAAVKDLGIAETPIAVIDFETSGLSPSAGDHVVEVSVVRCDPGEAPRLVLDTLVDPQGSVGCTEIHGIEEGDVIGAPYFSDVAGAIAHAVRGALVTSYNVYFDMPFLREETVRSRELEEFEVPPHFCMMWLRPTLKLGSRTTLGHALREAGLPPADHRAAHDALATALLWERYREHALGFGARTFGELFARQEYKFLRSWSTAPFDDFMARAVGPERTSTAMMPRTAKLNYGAYVGDAHHPHPVLRPEPPEVRQRNSYRATYFQALVDMLGDHELDADELRDLIAFRTAAKLTPGDVRALHAAYYADILRGMVADSFLSHDESERLRQVEVALRSLGWCPGDASR